MEFNILDFLAQLTIQKDGSEIIADCPVCGQSGSLKVNRRSSKYGCYKCDCTKEVVKTLAAPPPKTKRKTQKREWLYFTKTGQQVKVTRIDDGRSSKPDYKQYHKQGKRWVAGYGDIKREDIKLYQSDEVQKAIKDGRHIFIVEGESCADALRELGFAATTNIGGSLKWLKSHAQELSKAKAVVICPDRDKKGIEHADIVAQSLSGYGFPIRWLYADPKSIFWNPQYIPEAQGLDAVDWLQAGATKEDILGAIENDKRTFKFEKNTKASSVSEIEDTIDRWIEKEYAGAELIQALVFLSQKTKIHFSQLKAIADSKIQEAERARDIQDQSANFSRLVEARNKKIDLSSLLPKDLAEALSRKADSDRLDPIRLLQNLLPAVGTILGARLGIVGKRGEFEADSWIEYPIFFTADISPPSSGKSNASATIWKPIKDLQIEENKRHKKAMEEYQKLLDDWNLLTKKDQAEMSGGHRDPKKYFEENCHLKKWLFDTAQMEAVLKRLSAQTPKSGATWLVDELSGLFKGLDQYKKNGGDSQAILLEIWNGPITKIVDRASLENSYFIQNQCLSLCGGIQPEIAKSIWQVEDDPDGLVSRILPCLPEFPDNFATWSKTTVNLYGAIKNLVSKLAALPETQVHLDKEIESIWIARWEELSRLYLENLEDNPSYAYFLGKQKSYFLRFALVFHAIDCALGLHNNLEVVTAESLVKAWQLSDYYCAQFLLLQSQGCESEKLEGLLLKIWERCLKDGEISARTVQQNYKRRTYQNQSITSAVALAMLQSINLQGYGRLEGTTLYSSHRCTIQKDHN